MASSRDIYGIIWGHGRILPEKLVVIPEGITLRPIAKYSKLMFSKGEVTQDSDDQRPHLIDNNPKVAEDDDVIIDINTVKTKEDREKIFNGANPTWGHVYSPGDIIFDQTVKFKGEMLNRQYHPVGIITDADFGPDLYLTSEESIESNDETIYKNEEIYQKTILLSDILKRIVDTGKQGNYMIGTCRSIKDKKSNVELSCFMVDEWSQYEEIILTSAGEKDAFMLTRQESTDKRFPKFKNKLDTWLQKYAIYFKKNISITNKNILRYIKDKFRSIVNFKEYLKGVYERIREIIGGAKQFDFVEYCKIMVSLAVIENILKSDPDSHVGGNYLRYMKAKINYARLKA
jgi:hypothetical protein